MALVSTKAYITFNYHFMREKLNFCIPCLKDPDGRFAFLIPILSGVFGAGGIALSSTTIGAIIGFALGWGVYEACKSVDNTYNQVDAAEQEQIDKRKPSQTDKRKKNRTNPFEGPVEADVVVVDGQGNAIKVPEGNWLTGSKDGKWIQERTPDGTKNGLATGVRKDEGHKPSPVHTEIHVP